MFARSRAFNAPFASLAVRLDTFRAAKILATAKPATFEPEVAAHRTAYLAELRATLQRRKGR